MKALIVLFVLTYSLQPYMPFNEMALHAYSSGKFHWWQLFTYLFLHANIVHLAINCFTLYSFAGWLRLYVSAGRATTVFLFFTGCIIGGIAQANIPGTITVGCSAGICAIMGALAVLNPSINTKLLFFVVRIPLWATCLVIYLFSILCYINHFLTQVAHAAHMTGFTIGGLFAFLNLQTIKNGNTEKSS